MLSRNEKQTEGQNTDSKIESADTPVFFSTRNRCSALRIFQEEITLNSDGIKILIGSGRAYAMGAAAYSGSQFYRTEKQEFRVCSWSAQKNRSGYIFQAVFSSSCEELHSMHIDLQIKYVPDIE